jgi:hypothetical protein
MKKIRRNVEIEINVYDVYEFWYSNNIIVKTIIRVRSSESIM